MQGKMARSAAHPPFPTVHVAAAVRATACLAKTPENRENSHWFGGSYGESRFNALVHRHGPDTGILPAGGGPGPKPDAAVSLWGCCAKGESPDPLPLKQRIEEPFRRAAPFVARQTCCARGESLPPDRHGQRARPAAH